MEADRFLQPLPDYLTCPVCLEAAWEPYIVCPSEHVLCTSCCLAIMQTTQPACPVCRLPMLNPAKSSLAFTRALDSLQIRCKDGRCKWTGTISDEQSHRQLTCPFRLVECADCAEQYVYADEAKHRSTCPDVYVQCSRGGYRCGRVEGGGLFLRKNQKQHDEQCANWRCTVTPGCPTRSTRLNLPVHEAECGKVHRRVTDLEDELGVLRSKLTQRDAQRTRVSREKAELEERLAEVEPKPPRSFSITVPSLKRGYSTTQEQNSASTSSMPFRPAAPTASASASSSTSAKVPSGYFLNSLFGLKPASKKEEKLPTVLDLTDETDELNKEGTTPPGSPPDKRFKYT
ncbi:hypothetical protein JCM8097_001298 [Rhodosporidiobolus ruineniae]